MTLSSIDQSGRKMVKLRSSDSNAGAGGSIPMSVQTRASRAKRTVRRLEATLALAILSLALFALSGQAFAHVQDNPTDAQYAPQTQVLPPAPAAVPPVVQAPPGKPKEIQAGLGAGGGGGQPAERVAVPAAASGPSLPFTGLDVAALMVVALALAGTGVVLRRLVTIGDSEK
jgi:nucleoid-associated protein YgaU